MWFSNYFLKILNTNVATFLILRVSVSVKLETVWGMHALFKDKVNNKAIKEER